MKNPTTKLALIASLLTLTAVAGRASDSEPSQITPVSWILDTRHNGDVDDKHVTLIGQITKKDNGSDWWFTDGTGTVRLATGDLYLPAGPKLVIHGVIDHVDFGIFGHLEVDVKSWEYASKSKSTDLKQ